MLRMLPPPIGYVHLYHAVNAIGSVRRGTEWVSVRCQYELKYQLDANNGAVEAVIKSVAEACEAAKLAAAYEGRYRNAEDLARDKWHMPHWRNYFCFGTIDLYLPLLDDDDRPVLALKPVRCTREIFIRKDSLGEFIKSLDPPAISASRYPGDAALLEEGRRMIAQGMEKRAVARALAPRAEGASIFESKVDRLRKAL